ncbi:MAG: hypothetical protein HY556_02500 [Euryarchaeota archaeon]|nr:hypothetical protein [Euryarchaeota archaeon]
MGRRPGDAHRELVDPRAYEVVRLVISRLEEWETEYVLGGGWAVYAYGSRVPSADTDVFFPDATGHVVVERLASETGITTGQGAQLEALSLDGFNSILGQDPDFGEPDLGYVPRGLLAGRVLRRKLVLETETVQARVPTASALAFMKLKSFHDRDMAWQALRDPLVMSGLHPSERGIVRAKAESYYYRKAGKDLYDIAFLCSAACKLSDSLEISAEFGLREALRAPLENVAPQLMNFALDLAGGDRATETLLRDLENELPKS